MESEPGFTVFIRLPFPRDDFVDPPLVSWDASKDESLWDILSGASKTDLDWQELADRFQVTVDFLLRQATYLTVRHASHVRAQMRKATAARDSPAPSPIPGSESTGVGAEAMRRTASGGGQTPSALSIRKDSPLPKNDGSVPGTPGKTPLGRPQVSRNSSAGTAVVSQKLAESRRKRLSSLPIGTETATTTAAAATTPANESAPQSPGPAESSDTTSSSSSSSSPVQSRIIKRPPRFQGNQDGIGALGDEDDEAEPAFLPFQAQQPAAGSSSHKDLNATLKSDPRERAKHAQKNVATDPAQQSQTSDSSASSSALVSKPSTGHRRTRPGPLSPRRTAELAGRGGSAAKGKGYSREGSDGTPSMGSSFSDLDDASVTQSALEEALLSNMKDATIGSRMSTLGQSLRSRYLPKTNR